MHLAQPVTLGHSYDRTDPKNNHKFVRQIPKKLHNSNPDFSNPFATT